MRSLWSVTSVTTAMAESYYRAGCTLLICCSLVTYITRCSLALSSVITPSFNRWSASPRSTAKLNPTPLKALKVGLSASFFVVSAPFGRTIARETFACSISVASEVLIERLVDTMLAYDVWVCCSYRPIWMAPNSSWYDYSNCCSASAVTSCTVSSMSCKSPFVSVIGSNDTLLALYYFLEPTFSCSLVRLMRSNFICGFVPCYSIFLSISSFVSGEGDLAPLSKSHSVLPVCFSRCWVASHSTKDLPMTSFFPFLASCAFLSLASSFLCCVTDLLDPTAKCEVVRHSTGQRSRTTSIASSDAK